MPNTRPTSPSRRRVLTGTVLLVLGLGACSGTPEPDGTSATSAAAPGPSALSQAQGVTRVVFWHGLGGVAGENLQRLVDQFNAENSHRIQVEASYQGSYNDTLAKYTAAVRDGSAPTVLLSGDVSAGYLHDVGRSASPEAMAAANLDGLKLSDLRKAAINYYSADGKLLAVPMNVSVPVLWINEDVLRTAGVDPESLKTLSDVAAAAKTIKATTGTAGLVQPLDGWWFEQLVAGAGGAYCTPDNGRSGDGATKVDLTSGPQAKAIATITDLVLDGSALNTGVDGSAAVTAFTAGQAAMMFNSSGSAGTIAKSATFPHRALPYPVSGNTASSGPVIGGAALWLSSTATPAEQVAGWTFESFLVSARVQESFSQATGYVPVNTTVDDSPTEKAFLAGQPAAAAALQQVQSIPDAVATSGCLSGAMTAVRSAVVAQMQSAWSGAVPLEKALQTAQDNANKAVAHYREQRG